MADYKDYYDFSGDYRLTGGGLDADEVESADAVESADEAVQENTVSEYAQGFQDGFAQGREEAIAETLLTIIKAVYSGK